MKNYEYVLFDLDGTLTDPKVGITKSVAYALKAFGIEVEDLDSLCRFIGPPLQGAFMEYYDMSAEEGERAVEIYREYFRPYGVYENTVYEGIPELLSDLYERKKYLIVASSKPTVFVETVLKHFDLYRYFKVVVGSELNGERVDKAEVIEYALQKAGITDKAKALMIGDREHDIIGARKNGIATVGVTYGYGGFEELQVSGADVIVESVKELEELLKTC